MADQKLYAGAVVRRFRQNLGLTQAALADALAISGSYLNLIEKNQRPISASILLRLTEKYDFDPRLLSASQPGGGEASLRRRLADPLFASIDLSGDNLDQWISGAPGSAAAFARLYDHMARGGEGTTRATPNPSFTANPFAEVRTEIERWRNHFADLDAAAEAIAEDVRQGSGDLATGLTERLRTRHKIGVRVLPHDVAGEVLVRLDWHARQLQLSEWLDTPARHFAIARQLAMQELRAEIDALTAGAELPNPDARALFRRHVINYAAGALLMPYARFLRAAMATHYDVPLLQRRFGVSFEQLAHRLTTLGRVGARGLPFAMVRIDRAGQISKRYAGISGSPLVDMVSLCPLWPALHAFDATDGPVFNMVALEGHGDGEGEWLTIAMRTETRGIPAGRGGAVRVVALILARAQAGAVLNPATASPAVPIGNGCSRCLRPHCAERSALPTGHALRLDDTAQGSAPFGFESAPEAQKT